MKALIKRYISLILFCIPSVLPAAQWVYVAQWPWLYDPEEGWSLAQEQNQWVWQPISGWNLWGPAINNWAPDNVKGRVITALAPDNTILIYRFSAFQNTVSIETAAGHGSATYIYQRTSSTTARLIFNTVDVEGYAAIFEGVIDFDSISHGFVSGRTVYRDQDVSYILEFWIE